MNKITFNTDESLTKSKLLAVKGGRTKRETKIPIDKKPPKPMGDVFFEKP